MYMEAKLVPNPWSFLLINAYILSSTKLEIRAKQYLLGSEEVGTRRRGLWERKGEEGGSNDSIIVCTYE
jgi:hypothetical protein